MRKLEEIAETDEEKKAIGKLVAEIRNFTTDALKGMNAIGKTRGKPMNKISPVEMQASHDIQRKLYNSMFELFEKMHRIVDYPSFVILEDELRKSYGK